MTNVLWEHRGKLLFGVGVLVGLSSKVHVTIKKETVTATMVEEAVVDIMDSSDRMERFDLRDIEGGE